MTASLPSLGDGLYAVVWRVTSADGAEPPHPAGTHAMLADVAAALNMPEGSVKSTLSRSRDALRAALEADASVNYMMYATR